MKKLFLFLVVLSALVSCGGSEDLIDKCKDVTCNEWEQCDEDSGNCVSKDGNCNSSRDCLINEECNTNHECVVIAPVCEENSTKTIACGFNGNGNQTQICQNDSWANQGDCIDNDVCLNGSFQYVDNEFCETESFNGNGKQLIICQNGQWGEEVVCKDSDVCVNDSIEIIDEICGEDNLGSKYKKCVEGQWNLSDEYCQDNKPVCIIEGINGEEPYFEVEVDIDETYDCLPNRPCPYAKMISKSYDPKQLPFTLTWKVIQSPLTYNENWLSIPTTDYNGINNRDNHYITAFIPYLTHDEEKYVIELTVKNRNNLSSTCYAEVKGITTKALHIETIWDNPSDIDIHLMNPTNQTLTIDQIDENFQSIDPDLASYRTSTNTDWWVAGEGGNDCYYGNCTPDGIEWGSQGQDDNPSLIRDDVMGRGPETVVIKSPAQGWYRFAVNNFSNQGSTSTPTKTRIYCNGVLAYEQSADLGQRDLWWFVSDIYWETTAEGGVCHIYKDGRIYNESRNPFGGQVNDVEIDLCLPESNPCINNFTCENVNDVNQCVCAEGLEIRNGECVCVEGYELINGECVDFNECLNETDNCSENAICTNTVGSFICTCHSGFTGSGRFCSDINECTNNTDNCSAPYICSNTSGSFECVCPQGYAGENCDICAEDYHLETDICVNNTKEVVCANLSEKPVHATWNEENANGKFIQTWDETEQKWLPETYDCIWDCTAGYLGELCDICDEANSYHLSQNGLCIRNLIINGSFEEDFYFWDGNTTTFSEENAFIANEGKTGTKSLKLVNETQSMSESKNFASQPYTIKENTTYTCTAYVKGNGNIRFGFMYDSTYSYATYTDINNHNEWTQITGTFDSTVNKDNFQLILSVYYTLTAENQPDFILVDDVKCTF